MDTTNGTLTIQQVAEATGLSAYTLRYYEKIGLVHPIGRAGNTHRRYTESDVGWLNFLMKLRATGMSIQQMQVYAALQRQGDETLPQRLRMLKEHRAKVEAHVADLRAHIDILCWKISIYEEMIDSTQPEPDC